MEETNYICAPGEVALSANKSVTSLLEDGKRGFEANDFSFAQACFDAVIALETNEPQARIALARLALMQGKLDQATEHLDMLGAEPMVTALIRAVEVTRSIQNQSLGNAQTLLNEAHALAPELPEIPLLQAQVALVSNQFDEAKSLALLSLEKGVPTDQAQYYLGLAHLGLEEYEQSIECFVSTIAANPLHLDGYLHLGKMARALGVIAEMVELFQNGIRLMPSKVELREELCELYLLLNQIDLAFDQSLYILQYRQDAEDFLRAADLAMAMDCLDAAIEGYEHAMAVAPDDIRAHLGLGRIYLHGREYDKANLYFESALEIDANHPEALTAMATHIMETSRSYHEARALLKKALSQNPLSTVHRLNLVLCEFLAEDWAETTRLGEELLQDLNESESSYSVVMKLIENAKQHL